MDTSGSRGGGYAWVVLALLCLVYILNFLGRQLLSILTRRIQDDLGISDGQLGRLGGLVSDALRPSHAAHSLRLAYQSDPAQ
jgi:hypothetical protein